MSSQICVFTDSQILQGANMDNDDVLLRSAKHVKFVYNFTGKTLLQLRARSCIVGEQTNVININLVKSVT